MATAAVDVLGFLPCPVNKASNGPCQLFEGELLAYAASSAVNIVDVRTMQLAKVLLGCHRAAVTALSWCQERQSRSLSSQLRLASGDADGRVVVWDVWTGAAIASLDDPSLGHQREGGKAGGGNVRALAWCLSSSVLAIAQASGLFTIWDPQGAGGGVVWQKEFTPATSIQVDPSDARRLCLCGDKGSLVVLRLLDLARERIEQQTYRVDITASKAANTLQCAFSATSDLLYVLLPREMVVFDLEFGQPAASSTLGTSRSAFKGILGIYGHAAIGKRLTQGGIDLCYCSHQDGGLSLWRRNDGQLTYSLLGLHKLIPPPSRINNNNTLAVVGIAASPWHRSVARPARSTLLPDAIHTTASFAACFDGTGSSRMTADLQANEERTPTFTISEEETLQVPQPPSASKGLQHQPASSGDEQEVAGEQQEYSCRAPQPSLLVISVTDDGQLWLWDAPLESLHQLLQAGATSAVPPASPTQLMGNEEEASWTPVAAAPLSECPPAAFPSGVTKPVLLGMLHTLPHSVTTFSMCPSSIFVPSPGDGGLAGLPEQAVAVLAAVTAGGNVELVTLQRGNLMPLHPTVSVSLGAHRDVVRGVRWLGTTSRIASFSSEKTANGFHNTLLLTDVRNRASIAFRSVPVELAPMLGIRSSPLGRYLLLLLRGAPSEIWQVGGGSRPSRVRVLDLPFTAVEWVTPAEGQVPGEPMPTSHWTVWPRSPTSRERSLSGYSWDEAEEAAEGSPPVSVEDQPQENLAFALADGRVGVLSVKGRKVTDTKPKRPVWGMLGGAPDSQATAIAAWGQLVILGSADGSLSSWDTTTGRTFTVATNQGTVRRLQLAPPASQDLQNDSAPAGVGIVARVAVLFANGSFGVWELDQRNNLKLGAVTVSAGEHIGRVIDLAWAPLPGSLGGGNVLALATEDGCLAIVDAAQTLQQPSQRQRLATFRALLTAAGTHSLSVPLPRPSPVGSSLLLPRAWALLLSILLQSGVPAAHLQTILKAPLEQAAELDDQLWAYLPASLRTAWDRKGHTLPAASAKELSSAASDQAVRAILRRTLSPPDGSKSGVAGSSIVPRDSSGSKDSASSHTPSKQAPGAGADAAQCTGDASTSGRGQDDGQPFFKSSAMSSLAARVSQMARAGVQAAHPAEGVPATFAFVPLNGASSSDPGPSASEEQQQLAPLALLVKILASMRAGGALLHPSEWAAYQSAVEHGSCAERMAVAADVCGSHEEAAFWRGLPATLAILQASLPAFFTQAGSDEVLYKDQQSGIVAFRRSSSELGSAREGTPKGSEVGSMLDGAGEGRPEPRAWQKEPRGELWGEAMQVVEARERAAWHEVTSRRAPEQTEALQERRVLEYVALGDYQTAVGFLLASTPDRSARYYRDALCTIALAAASTEAYQASAPGIAEPVSRTLHIQAAKVVTAHAASVGDTTLGVPLLCSAGLPVEAVGMLMDAGLWRYAATLAAHALPRDEQAAALERWASHIHQAEGDMWRALGVLTAAGALRAAVLLLRKSGHPDCAAAFVDAACKAGFGSKSPAVDAGGLENWHHTGNTPVRQRSFASSQPLSDTPEPGSVASGLEHLCIDVLQHL